MRPYQEEIVQDVIDNFGIDKPYVLGSCPSSGKTEMAIEAMVRLIESGQVNRVLVLAHSTNVLKENFYERLTQYFEEGETIDIMRGQRRYNHDALIQVMIPQNIGKINGQFDLVVTDEAHHNVLAEDGNYSRIIEMVKPKFQLLLTGTPSKFIRENGRLEEGQEELYYIKTVGMDLIGFDNFHDVRFDLIKSAYGFTNEDYNHSKNISEETKFSFEETERTINNVIIGAVRNIALRNGITLAKNSDFIKEGKELIKQRKFGKTLIMCRNIEQANQVKTIISKLFEIKVHVSESKSDTDSVNLTKFKDNEFDFLCVVNRAREGYDDKKIINLIDITMTHNIDLIYQMFCRVVRKDVDNPNTKLYLKVTSNAEGMPEYTMNIMTASLMLGSTENLSRFNGSNFRNIVMPRIERERTEGDETDEDDVTVTGVVDVVDNEGNQIRRRRITDLMALDLIRIFSEDYENLIHGNDRYAMTTLGESLDILNGVFISPEETFNLCVQNILTSGGVYDKFREANSNLKLYVAPWMVNNESSSNFFNRVKETLGLNYISVEETYNICVKNKIIGAKLYRDFRKKSNLKLHSTPWKVVNKNETIFFNEIKKELNIGITYSTTDYTFNLCVENTLISSPQYRKFRDKNPHLKLLSSPWETLNKKSKLFFEEVKEVLGLRYLSPEETFNLCVNEKIVDGTIYKSFRNKLMTLHSRPWRLLGKTQLEFFDSVKNELNLKQPSLKEIFQLCVDNKLISNVKYKQFFNENKDLNLIATPWSSQKLKQAEYFALVKKELGIGYKCLSLEETFQLCIDNRLVDSTKYYNFRKENINIKTLNEPWVKMGKTLSEYFNDVKKSLSFNKLTYDETVNICVKNELTSGPLYHKFIEENSDMNFFVTPWTIKKIKQKDFFNIIKKIINSKTNIKPKRDFNPDHLGEVSRITKMGKTTSAENINKFFKENPQEFFNYHKLRKDNMDYWDEAPYEEIAKKITDPNDKVIDFGCGSNDLKKELKNNQVTPIDHIAFDESVIACDMSDISKFVDDNSHDVAVFSLSLWGTQENRESYLKEAFRVLKRKGVVYVAEAIGDIEKLETKKEKMIHVITNAGFDIIDNIDVRERFIYITGIKM